MMAQMPTRVSDIMAASHLQHSNMKLWEIVGHMQGVVVDILSPAPTISHTPEKIGPNEIADGVGNEDGAQLPLGWVHCVNQPERQTGLEYGHG